MLSGKMELMSDLKWFRFKTSECTEYK